MNYPLLSEYIESVRDAADNFDELCDLECVCHDDGSPIFSSGNFAVVFKMRDSRTGKVYAVKCFTKEQSGRSESYRMIADALEYTQSLFLTPVRYLKNELFVDTQQSSETEFPVVLMDWVEGTTLDKFVRDHLSDAYRLSRLTYSFSKLAEWLVAQRFAHGDIKPDNIMVKEDGSAVLVDYDGMYVPEMSGQAARELGSPDFRHPRREQLPFDEHIDDFALTSILLSLKSISLDPSLLQTYGAADRLLFSESDYRDLSQSSVFCAVCPSSDSEQNLLASLFLLAHAKGRLEGMSQHLLALSRPQKGAVAAMRKSSMRSSNSVRPSTSASPIIHRKDKYGIEWVDIPAGKFMMGSNAGHYGDEEPVHEVQLSSFQLSKYPVTFAQYDAFCEATGRDKPDDRGWGRGNRPVINVTWYDAVAYCEWVGGRLPTEAEWEYACRAGSQTEYYWGDEMDGDYCWYTDNSNHMTHPVGEKLPNVWGLHDMLGNVWEWCADWWGEDYYQQSPQLNPKGPESGFSRVIRGGSWDNDAVSYRSAYRDGCYPGNGGNLNGFRVARGL